MPPWWWRQVRSLKNGAENCSRRSPAPACTSWIASAVSARGKPGRRASTRFGWEPGVLIFPGYVKRLTVAYYLQNPGIGAVVLLAVIVAAIAASIWTIEHREYVLQQ